MSDFSSSPVKYALKTALVLIVVGAAFFAGYYLPTSDHDHTTPPTAAQTSEDNIKSIDKKPQLWTCSMHPQIKLPHPGKCPICFMELIPLTAEESAHAARDTQYVMSVEAQKLAEIETAEVKRGTAKVVIRMVGLIYEDETRVASLTSRVDGRLDEIYINFTGVQVNEGDPMVKIWSPTLIKSQVELFEALRSETDPGVIRGAEEKLVQQGMTRDQIDDLIRKRKPNLYVTLHAPISGVVTKKMAILGQFVKEGTEMYAINDLSHVWIKLDAYEPDLPWIRYGQDVIFTTQAAPGRTFKGKVLFIDPMLDMKTRSVKVRVEAENPDFLLKPGMFVSAEIESEIDDQGKVIKSEWVGKYICPVHPRDVVSDKPGVCPDSKMKLQPASSFGYADDPNPKLPLIIPATAPLITGKRTIVYVEVPGAQPTYELREVTLGSRAGDVYVVSDGLREGERVVVKGNFKIDSAMQILGRSSMMSSETTHKDQEAPKEEVISKLTGGPEFLKSLNPLIVEYLEMKKGLSEDIPSWSAPAAQRMAVALDGVNLSGLKDQSLEAWNKFAEKARPQLTKISDNLDLEIQRSAFDVLSEAFVRLLMGFRPSMNHPLYIVFCEKAAGGAGAYWIEDSRDFKNPYFGGDREKEACGDLEETIQPEGADVGKDSQDQGHVGQSPQGEK